MSSPTPFKSRVHLLRVHCYLNSSTHLVKGFMFLAIGTSATPNSQSTVPSKTTFGYIKQMLRRKRTAACCCLCYRMDCSQYRFIKKFLINSKWDADRWNNITDEENINYIAVIPQKQRQYVFAWRDLYAFTHLYLRFIDDSNLLTCWRDRWISYVTYCSVFFYKSKRSHAHSSGSVNVLLIKLKV